MEDDDAKKRREEILNKYIEKHSKENYLKDLVNKSIGNKSDLKTPARIIGVNKEDFIKKQEFNQRMFMLMHEYAVECNSKMPPRPYIDHEAEQKKYFENFPFDEQAVRDYLQCKKELGYFKEIDVQTVKLSDILSYPNYNYGFRILNVTVGKGTHKGGYRIAKEYEVNEDEVYITYNNMYNLAGGVYTVVMQRKDGVNKLIKSYCYARS